MNKNLVSTASARIDASRKEVWNALVDPEAIRQYMFGAQAISEWQVGSSIVWKGEWQGKSYEDKGVILQFKPGEKLQYSHFSPLSGVPDEPENYHTVTVELASDGDQTLVSLTQDRNASEEEQAESARNWGMMLAAMMKYVEETPRPSG